jgi:hypothetical protein
MIVDPVAAKSELVHNMSVPSDTTMRSANAHHHEAAGHEERACEEKARFNPRQRCSITHACLQCTTSVAILPRLKRFRPLHLL